MEIEYTASVASVRQKAMELLGLAEDGRPRRFRATNWSQEAGDLVEEFEFLISKSGRVLVERTMEIIDGLVEGSMLLLEEGEAPILGARPVEVYIWKDSMRRRPNLALVTTKNKNLRTYQGNDIESMSKDQIANYLRALLPKKERVPNKVTDKRTDKKVAQDYFVSFLTRTQNSDFRDKNTCLESGEAEADGMGGDEKTDHKIDSDMDLYESVNAGYEDSKGTPNKNFNCRQLFHAGRVYITPDTSLVGLYHSVFLLLQDRNDSVDRLPPLHPIASSSLSDLIERGWHVPKHLSASSLHSTMLLRDLRGDKLPGKCHRMSVSSSSATDTSPKLKSIKNVVLELFPSPSSSHELRFWLVKLENPLDCKEEGKAEMSPIQELYVNGGAAPSLGHLKNAVRGALSLGSGTTRIYKFNETRHRWTELKSKSAVRGKTPSILQPPLSLKEGDVLCAFEETSMMTRPGEVFEPVVDRLEDAEMRNCVEETKRTQSTSVAKKSKARVEVALRIGDGFDYSTSSDEGENC